MNLTKVYEMQRELDQAIEKVLVKEKKGHFSLSDELVVENRKYAFQVELMEFANEVGFFKYWKRSHKMNIEKALEEFVDCIHFLVSLAITRKWNLFITEVEAVNFWEECPIDELFYMLRENGLDSSGKYIQAFQVLLGIARKLGWSDDDILASYIFKNSINRDRLARGY
jgi:dimeric dUTPase (all-alpha-NTP-PPase superfamily)